MIHGYRLRDPRGREAEARRAFTAMESGLFDPVTIRTEAGFEVTAYEWLEPVEGLEELDGRRGPAGGLARAYGARGRLPACVQTAHSAARSPSTLRTNAAIRQSSSVHSIWAAGRPSVVAIRSHSSPPLGSAALLP